MSMPNCLWSTHTFGNESLVKWVHILGYSTPILKRAKVFGCDKSHCWSLWNRSINIDRLYVPIIVKTFLTSIELALSSVLHVSIYVSVVEMAVRCLWFVSLDTRTHHSCASLRVSCHVVVTSSYNRNGRSDLCNPWNGNNLSVTSKKKNRLSHTYVRMLVVKL